MRVSRLAAVLIAGVLVLGCNKDGGGNPAAPSTPTRIIALSGNLDFGVVQLGDSADRAFTIQNTGNSPLTVTGLTGPAGGAFAASFTNGTIPAGGSQAVTLRFTPQEPRIYSGVLTVEANQTSGNNGININATGDAPIWQMTGFGNTVFDMPTYIERVEVFGEWNRTSNSNFIVRVDGSLIVNAILRDSITYQGTHLVRGGVTEITSSGQISWRFTEVRVPGGQAGSSTRLPCFSGALSSCGGF